jgi:hypothetical protein
MDVKSCVFHIKDNIEKKFGNNVAQSFFNAANDTTTDGFYQKLGVISQRSFVLFCILSFNIYLI